MLVSTYVKVSHLFQSLQNGFLQRLSPTKLRFFRSLKLSLWTCLLLTYVCIFLIRGIFWFPLFWDLIISCFFWPLYGVPHICWRSCTMLDSLLLSVVPMNLDYGGPISVFMGLYKRQVLRQPLGKTRIFDILFTLFVPWGRGHWAVSDSVFCGTSLPEQAGNCLAIFFFPSGALGMKSTSSSISALRQVR